ncbi:52 kDa repressor of the inhibitor of the protein kinase-like [Xenia sp. Carnegie-2017]|uniref:52 kDa repressor of the inhibitor of the protein kinase-like n=1 Tax=Xenia sp. Carnegie-2017 TaxID=2897299 RepID=UPI001F04CFA9|nr:52 kDa repressor of the inhibitor of the protein kinase-like [Xenia sp. Carnegie-2017]
MKGKTIGIDEQADHLRSARIQYNRDVLGSIIKTIILPGRQNLPLRGHRDDSKYFLSSNPGNFQAFLNFRVDAGDAKLEKHFENASKNATYCSKTIQNKLIKICGEQIKEKIVSDINSSECPIYSVLGDEATDCSSTEQMPIVVRYVDSKQEINERFIKFVECEGMTGEALAKNIEDTLNEVGLLLSNCRGQCYDGASAMSSKSKGVAGRILKKNPKALYIHCASHRLNLVVAKACGEQTVKNMLGHAQKIFSFFSPSPLRMQCLRQNMEKSGLRRKKLGAPSTTRWVERIRTLDGFVEAFVPVCQSLEYMKLNMNKDFDNSSRDAEGYLRSIKSFEFIVNLVITSNVLHHTMSLTVQLQQRMIDIAESIKHINLLKSQLKILRSSADTIHDQYYEEAVDLANRVNVDEKIPRLCNVQTTRENYPAHTAREYYRMKLTIPLLDHLIEQMEFRFSSEVCDIYRGFYIIPSIFLHCKDVNWKEEFMKFAVAYKEDMPHFRKIHAELGLWETNWKGGFEKVKYDSIADTHRTCNKLAFPNIFTALKILAVVPVYVCVKDPFLPFVE